MAKFEPTRPDYTVRCQDPTNKERWLTIGAGWSGDNDMISIRLSTLPVGGFDGKLKLLPQRDQEAPEYKVPD